MQVELSGEQWDAVTTGSFEGPDGVRYRRRSTRMRRRQVDALLAAGAPLVLYWFGGEQLNWFQDQDAEAAWKTTRHRLTNAVPGTAADWLTLHLRDAVLQEGCHCA